MDQRPWIERTLGESWQTTLSGFGGALLAIICIVLAKQYDIPSLDTLGQIIMAGALAALGISARSNSASYKKAQQLDTKIDTTAAVTKVEAKQAAVQEVKQQVVETAEKVAERTAEVKAEQVVRERL